MYYRPMIIFGSLFMIGALLIACSIQTTTPAAIPTHSISDSPVVPPTSTPITSLAYPTHLPILTSTSTEKISQKPSGYYISGIVLDEQNQPVADATVRIQTTDNQTTSDDQGFFVLTNLKDDTPVTVSAWKESYYCAYMEKVSPPIDAITLTLRLYQTNDNSAYAWIPPTGENSCYSCKPGVTQVWLDNDAHGKSATNRRFLTMYNGTDVEGNQSPPTRYATTRDYGRIPLRPDLSQPYYGPGYKLDFPDTAGNCAACHTPGESVNAAYDTNPNKVSSVNLFGVHCDFCHKIADVKLNSITGLPYPNMPGVLSMDIRRPFPEDSERYQLFFGTFDDDNVPKEDTKLSLIMKSQYCAPCHFGVFWDALVYNSFGEWLDSPYSNPQSGKTCQQCHMPAPTMLGGQPITNVAPEKGGVERDPLSIHAHTFPGAANLELLQNSVSMLVDAQYQDDQVVVTVSITNDKTGHHIPTDSPLRQMILLITAKDAKGEPLTFLDGETIPAWGGIGDPAKGYYAGLPGKGYAKILQELWTEISPSGAYWNPTRLLSDNRIPAFATDTSSYTFQVTNNHPITLEVKLLFRRAFKSLQDQKGWTDADILMEQQTLTINP